MAKKDSFVLYTDQKAVIDKLSNEQAGKLIKAIYTYVETEQLPKLDMTLDLVITPFITTIDRDKQKYIKKCNENKNNANKRWNKKNTNVCDCIQTNTNYADSDSDTDSVSDNDTDSDNNNSDVVSDSCVDGLQEIIDFYNNNIGAITPFGLETLLDYAKEMPSDLIILAMKKATEANIRTIQYIKGILNNWSKKGVKTVADAEREDEQFKKNNKKQTKNEISQRDYSDDEFSNLYTNLGGKIDDNS